MSDPIDTALRTYLGPAEWARLQRLEKTAPGTIAAARLDMRRAVEAFQEAARQPAAG